MVPFVPLDLAAADPVPGMGHDAVHVVLDEPGEPLEVLVPRAAADGDDLLHHVARAPLLPVQVGDYSHVK